MPKPRDPTAVLAAHGLPPGPDGYAQHELAAFAEARGWRASAEPVARPTAWVRYRAAVWRPGDPRRGPYGDRLTVGRGPTAAAALALALASALADGANGRPT